MFGENDRVRPFLIVATTGACGAAVRWGVAELIERPPDAFPWATLLVNLIGCFAIGVAARLLVRGSDRWLGVTTGFLGGLTTFSTFAVETWELADAGRGGLALLYVAASVIGGLAATEIARGGGGRR